MKLAYPSDRPKLKPALRRVLAARAGMACTEVAEQGVRASVFALRKRAKECRGVLRLLRGGWEDAALWSTRIRDAAAKLAPARDAEVMLDRFDSLTARRRAPSEFDSLRDVLLDEIEIAEATTDPDAIAKFAATMADFARAAETLQVANKIAPVVWGNLARTWSQGQRAYTAAAEAADDAAAFHDWRKRLKQHWYQARFFKPVDKAGLRAHIAQVDTLGKTLGAHNDLDMLHRVLRANCADDPALARLERDLTTAQAGLARNALELGAELYAAPNPALGWSTMWQAWRKG